MREYDIYILIVLLSSTEISSLPVSDDFSGSIRPGPSQTNVNSNSSFPNPIYVAFISLGLLVALSLILIICVRDTRRGSCTCWPWKLFRNQTPISSPVFSNPIASDNNLTEIDVRALELDSIVFEPLPSLTEITRGSTESHHPVPLHRNGGSIVPFTDESSIFAHDWFDEPFRNFPRGNLEYIKIMGKGWFGQVISANAKGIVPYAPVLPVVIKHLREDSSAGDQIRFLDENRLYRDSQHSNILQLLGFSIERTPFLLIFESTTDDLKSFLIQNIGRFDLMNQRGDILRMALDIAKGLQYMSNIGFTHGDLAARTCRVATESRIIIGDYGLGTSTFRDDYYWSGDIAIPLRWAAPESLHCTINTIQTLKLSPVSNVWTFGVVLWEICEFGKIPYYQLTDDEVISKVLGEETTLSEPNMSILYKKELYLLMKLCWKKPSNRINITKIVDYIENLLLDFFETFERKFEEKISNQKFGKKSVKFYDSLFQDRDTAETVPKQDQSNSKRDNSDMIINNNLTDDEELSRVLRGEITEKVRLKSRSVQDLMVLTHVESDIMKDCQPSPLKKSCSEGALNVCDKKEAPQNSEAEPDIPSSTLPFQVESVHEKTKSSPTSDSLEVSVVGESTEMISYSQPLQRLEVDNGRRIRLTSTPRKSPSPLPVNKNLSNGNSSIGEADSSDPFFDETLSLSPISKSETVFLSTQNSTPDTESLVYGPSDELGLRPYQCLSTAIPDTPWRGTDETTTSHFESISLSGGNIYPKGERSKDKVNSSTFEIVQDNDVDRKGNANSLSTSWSMISNTDKPSNQPDEDDFWEKQLGSLQNAAGEARAIIRLGLEEPNTGEVKASRETFVEDIQHVNEELDSLVLYDLDNILEQPIKISEARNVNEDAPNLPTASTGFGEFQPQSIAFKPSKWDSSRNPSKSAIKSPEVDGEFKKSMRKSVSFDNDSKQLVYSYPPPLPSDEDDHLIQTTEPSDFPQASSLDWDLDPDQCGEMTDDNDEFPSLEKHSYLSLEKPAKVKTSDLYRISAIDEDVGGFNGASSSPLPIPIMGPPSTLGELRHTRDRLKLDFTRHSLGETGTSESTSKLDSGVGSANVSPFPL